MGLLAEPLGFLLRQAHDHGADHHAGHHDGHHAEHGGDAAAFCAGAACQRNWRIAFAVILLLEGVVFGYVALLMRRFACLSAKRFNKFLHFVNCAGGGIFLATGLLHVLPEAIELLSGGDPHGTHAEHGAHAAHADIPPLAANASRAEAIEHALAEQAHALEEAAGGHAGHEITFPTAFAVVLLVFFVFLFFDRVLFARSHAHGHDAKSPAVAEEDDEQAEDAEQATGEEEGESSTPAPALNGFASPQFLSSAIFVVGLAAHSLFESIVLGSSGQFSTILNTFIAIATHRWATAMALGSRFAKGNLAAIPYSVLIVLFSLVAPVGVALGVAVQAASTTFQGVIFALSAGTFLYMGAFEAVADEFVAHPKWPFAKFAIMVAGAGLMVIITGILVAKKIH